MVLLPATAYPQGYFSWAKGVGDQNNERGNDLEVAEAENGAIYVTGSFEGTVDFTGDDSPDVQSEGKSDIFVAKYTSTGSLKWVVSAGGFEDDAGNGLTVLPNQNGIVVTGTFHGEADFNEDSETDATGQEADIFLARYTTEGDLDWVYRAGSPVDDVGQDVAVGPNGDAIYLTGTLGGEGDFDRDGNPDAIPHGNKDAFLAEYDPNGSFNWALAAGGPEDDSGNALAIDPTSGDIYVTGSFQSDADFDQNGTTDASSLGNRDAFVAKYEDDGDLMWANRAGGSSDDRGLGISVTSDGSQIYATGFFQGDADFDGDQSTETSGIGGEDIYLASYNSDGSPKWAKAAGGNLDDRGLAATTSPNGDQVYVTGLFRNKPDFDGDGQQEMAGGGTGEKSDIFVASYDGSGSLVGASPATSSENNAGLGLDVTSGDTERRVYLTGYYALRASFAQGARSDITLDYFGNRDFFLAEHQAMETSTAAPSSVTVPTEPVLQANYPDPAHSQTTVSFTVPEATSVTLTLFNLNGEKITVLADRYFQTGDHRLEVDVSALNLPAGVYLLHLQAGATTRTETVTVVQ